MLIYLENLIPNLVLSAPYTSPKPHVGPKYAGILRISMGDEQPICQDFTRIVLDPNLARALTRG
jgi:hypothetical protein